MKTVSKPLTKQLIMNLVQFQDGSGVGTDKEQTVKRTYVPTNHYRGYAQLQSRILDTLEIGYLDLTKEMAEAATVDDIIYVPMKAFVRDKTKRVVGERYTDAPAEFGQRAVDAFKWFAEDRKDWPIGYDEATLDEVYELIGKPKEKDA